MDTEIGYFKKPEVASTRPRCTSIEDALAAVDVGLSSEEIRSLEELYTPHLLSGYE